MTFAITTAFNEGRLEGARNFLDTGVGRARVRIYGGIRPASVNDVPGTPLLVEIELTDPCGEVVSNQLVLTGSGLAQVATSGLATWGRFVNGDGVTAGDGDVSSIGGSGDIKISNTTLWQGGFVSLISAVMS